jgi:hypothetical protein
MIMRCSAGPPGWSRTVDVTFRVWITSPAVWTANRVPDFFRTHPVHCFSAAYGGVTGGIRRRVPSCIPSLRTAPAACLHSLSTGLCTR